MKRSFREPKNRYKNGAKNDRKKIATLRSAQSLENKGKMQGGREVKKPNIAKDTAQIRLTGKSKRD